MWATTDVFTMEPWALPAYVTAAADRDGDALLDLLTASRDSSALLPATAERGKGRRPPNTEKALASTQLTRALSGGGRI